MGDLRYHRILLKLSGEALGGPDGTGVDVTSIQNIAKNIIHVHSQGVQIGIVIGAGNIWRGVQRSAETGFDRTTADYMGMLATVINALALQAVLENMGLPTRVQSALGLDRVAEPYIRRRAMRHFEKERVVIFAAGTGNPFFTTDTAAALRAAEINAEALLKATTVEGVYDADPRKHPEATLYQRLTYQEVLRNQLAVMDQTAVSLCSENKLPIIVFNMHAPDAIMQIVRGRQVGTLITDTP